MRRFHIALAVASIADSVEEYTRRLGTAPAAVVDERYALWRTGTLNFSISQLPERAGQMRHLGFEDDTVTGFASDEDVNGIEWESFSPAAQDDEIRAVYGDPKDAAPRTGGPVEDGGWHEAKPGVTVKTLSDARNDGGRTMLFRLAPGAVSQPHAHVEFEHVYVLEGAFHDGERLLRAGDFCVRPPGEVHSATCEDGAVALVTYIPVPAAAPD